MKTLKVLVALIIGIAASTSASYVWQQYTDVPVWASTVGASGLSQSPYNDLTTCIEVQGQFICFDEKETWFGTDVFPVYFVEDGVMHLF